MDKVNGNVMLCFVVSLYTIYKMCFCDHINTNGTCTRNLVQGQNVALNFCCRHFENINGQCQACKPGFTTNGNTPCFPCDTGFFGEKCANTCYCHSKHRCDNVKGCVVLNQSLNGTCLDTDISTHTVFNEKGSDTEPKTTENKLETTTAAVIESTFRIIRKETSYQSAIMTGESLHYIYGGIICIILLVFCIAFVCKVVLKRLTWRSFTEFLGTRSQSEDNDKAIYHYIDEKVLDMLDRIHKQMV